MAKKKPWTRYLVPGFVFQSVVIGGGYGTGAEIMQYFGANGLVGGLLGLTVTMITWSVLCAVTFEFVCLYRTFDYSSMMSALLGRAGVLYELCYIGMLLLVLGVINATAGSMVHNLTGLSPWAGVLLLAGGMFLLVIKGTETVERALSLWSYVLSGVYFLFMVIVFVRFGGNVSAEFARGEAGAGWFSSGLQYAFYNLGIVPALLYTVRDVRDRREAAACGLLAGVIGVIPAALLLLAMSCNLSAAASAEVPVTVIFRMLDMKWLYVLFEIVLFGTLVETGAGFIKAVDDRVERSCAGGGRRVPRWMRLAVTAGLVLAGIGVSTFGLTDLIAKGYGTICWGFLLVYVLPMLSIGVGKCRFRSHKSNCTGKEVHLHGK